MSAVDGVGPVPADGVRQRGVLARFLTDPRHWLPLVLLLTALAYLPSLANGFAMDDRAFAMGATNPMVGTLHAPIDYFLAHYYEGISPSSELYRPVTILSYALRHAVAGDAPLPAHLCNLLLHVCATWLCYRLLRAARAPHAPACLGALVFGLHALRSEAVANVVGRAELLGFVFGAAGCLLFLAAFPSRRSIHGPGDPDDPRSPDAGPMPKPTRRRIGLACAAAVALFLAFGSKENAVCWVPFIALMVLVRHPGSLRGPGGTGDRHAEPGQPGSGPSSGIHWRRVLPAVATLVVPVLLWAILRHEALARVAVERDPTVGYLRNPLYFETGPARYATAMLVWGHGLLLSLFPFSLSADWSHPVFPIVRDLASGPGLAALAAAAAITALGVLCLRSLRRRPLLGLGLACLLGFSFVLSNLLVRTGTIFGERTWYTPCLGLSFLVAWMANELLNAEARRTTDPETAPSPVPAPITLLALAAMSCWLGASTRTVLARIPVWHDDATLFVHEARNQPRSARMQVAAAAIHAGRGEHRTAELMLLHAVALDPGYAEAWRNLGAARLNLGEPAAARQALLQGLRARPWSLELAGPDIRASLALACLRLDRHEEALRWLASALEASPVRLRARRDVEEAVLALVRKGDAPRALRERAAALGREAFAGAARPPR